MEYAAETQLDTRNYGSGTVAPRPADLCSLRSQLEDCLGRARDHANRIEGIGDQVFGPHPTAIGSAKAQTGPASIVELVSDLDSTLSRIGYALNRL
jgi:hypothetical protein